MSRNAYKPSSLPPMIHAQKLIGAAQVGNIALVRRFLKKGVDVHFVENTKLGYNALHYAAFNGHKEVILELLSAGADVNAVTTDNYSAFMLASLGGFTEIIEMLLQITQPDLTITTQDDAQSHNGLTCLHLAVMSGNNDLMYLLISHGANAEAITNMGYTVLHLAAELSHTSILNTLLSEVPALYTAPHLQLTTLGNTALHLAVNSGVRKSVTKLLQNNTANINTADQEGYTALHLAVTYQLPYIVETLLEHGADVNTQSNTGQTPLLDAVLQGQSVLVEMLVKHGAEVALTDKTGTTPLIAAAIDGNEEIVSIILNHRSNVVASYVDTKSGPDSIDVKYTIDLYSEEHIAKLCNHRNKDGHSALDIATIKGYNNIVKRLLLAGAKPTEAHINVKDIAKDNLVTDESVTDSLSDSPTVTEFEFADLHSLSTLSTIARDVSPENDKIQVSANDQVSKVSQMSDSSTERPNNDIFKDIHPLHKAIVDHSVHLNADATHGLNSIPTNSGSSPQIVPCTVYQLNQEDPIPVNSKLLECSEGKCTYIYCTSTRLSSMPLPETSASHNSPVKADEHGESAFTAQPVPILVHEVESKAVTNAQEEDWFVVDFDITDYPTTQSPAILYTEVDTTHTEETPYVRPLTPSRVEPIRQRKSKQARPRVARIKKSQHRKFKSKRMSARHTRQSEQSIKKMKMAKRPANECIRVYERKRPFMKQKSYRIGHCLRRNELKKRKFSGATIDTINTASTTNNTTIMLQRKLKKQKKRSAQLAVRVDKLSERLQVLENFIKDQYIHRDEHEHIVWDQEIEFF